MTRLQLRSAARKILREGLAAVEPGHLVRSHLRLDNGVLRVAKVRASKTGRVFVVSAGKAAFPMARAAHRILGRRITAAIVITPEKSPALPRTRSFIAGHPIPNSAGVRAGREVMDLLAQAGADDLVVLLLSGGASALMPAPIGGVSLSDKQHITRLLLGRGASIAELNAVRKQLSQLKGGGFARLAAPARVVTLALSDVRDDDIQTIGSGPTMDDPQASRGARRAVLKYFAANEISPAVRRAVHERKKTSGTSGNSFVVIGSGRTFAAAAKKAAKELDFRTVCQPDTLRGEARLNGPALVRRFAVWRRLRPCCLIATGETVVTVRGAGQGGRNQEVALSAVPALARLNRPTVVATFATDGRDGKSVAAGGIVDDQTAERAAAKKLSLKDALDRNASTAALRRLGSLIVTGPTGTNVADLALILG